MKRPVTVAPPDSGAVTAPFADAPLQLPNVHTASSNGCVGVVLTWFAERASTVRVNGVRSVSLPSEISSPAGSLATVRSEVRGISVALCLGRQTGRVRRGHRELEV